MTTPTAEESRAILETLTGYTPGPWIEGVDGNMRVYGPDSRGEHSGLIAPVFKGRANTRLIAAAPDLAAHLRAALDRETAALASLHQVSLLASDRLARMTIAEAERDAARAEVERLTGALTAANDMSTVRAIEIIMARLKMDQETQRIMRAQLHHARAALASEHGQ